MPPPIAALLVTFALLLAAPRAGAQIASAELYFAGFGGVSASDQGLPLVTEQFNVPPYTEDIFLTSDSFPWDLSVTRGGGSASSRGTITWRTNLAEIELRGIEMRSRSTASLPATALHGFDAVVSVSFQVETETVLRVAGRVSSSRALDAPEVVSCQWGGTILAGDTRATPLAPGTYPFDEERSALPGETYTVMCAAATSGGMNDDSTLAFDLTVSDPLPEPDGALSGLAALGALGLLRPGAGARSRRRARSPSAHTPESPPSTPAGTRPGSRTRARPQPRPR